MDTPKNISILYRKMNMRVNAELVPLGLSGAKAVFLFCLYDHPPMSQAEICRDLNMDKSAVAKMLVRLEKDGRIPKAVKPEDVCSFRVTLTDKAKAMAPQAREIYEQWPNAVTGSLTQMGCRNCTGAGVAWPGERKSYETGSIEAKNG